MFLKILDLQSRLPVVCHRYLNSMLILLLSLFVNCGSGERAINEVTRPAVGRETRAPPANNRDTNGRDDGRDERTIPPRTNRDEGKFCGAMRHQSLFCFALLFFFLVLLCVFVSCVFYFDVGILVRFEHVKTSRHKPRRIKQH